MMPHPQLLLDRDLARVASTRSDEVDAPDGESLQIELLADTHTESLVITVQSSQIVNDEVRRAFGLPSARGLTVSLGGYEINDASSFRRTGSRMGHGSRCV